MPPTRETLTIDDRRSVLAELRLVTSTLIAEFAGLLPPGTVIRSVAMAREQLLRAGVRQGLAAAAESMARLRLQGLTPAHATAG